MRQWAFGLGLAVFLAGGIVADSPTTGLPPVLDLSYGSDPMQSLDVYPAASPSPAVIVVHGGGWTRGDKSLAEIRDTSASLQARGFAVFSINYRLADDSTPGTPMQAEDVTSAVNWVVENGARYGADDTAVALLGGSSGAQLVSLAGQQINAAEPGAIRGIVSLSGPMDFVALVRENLTVPVHERTGKTIPTYLGCRLAQCTQEQMEGPSPLHNIGPSSPAFLIVNSEHEIVPIEQARAMQDALTAAGRSSTLLVVPGEGHGLSLFSTVEDEVVQFLRT